MTVEKPGNEILLISKQKLEKCKALVALAEEQREILVSGRHTELEENARKYDFVLSEISRLDQLEQNPAIELNCTDMDFEQKRSEILFRIADEAAKLKILMETNAELLGNAMNYITFSMSLLSRLAADQPSYDPRGESALSSAIVLDLKV